MKLVEISTIEACFLYQKNLTKFLLFEMSHKYLHQKVVFLKTLSTNMHI